MKKSLILLASVLLLTACNSTNIDDKNIVVGASSTPHALILEQTRKYIESKGYTLDIKIMNDYVTPNIALSDGDLDANYFQHEPYLLDFNENYKTELVGVKKIHFEPMGIYQGSLTNGKIIIPNDKSNGDRARELLTLNGYSGDIVEVEAQSIPLMLSDCQYACINGNYALSSGVVDKVLVTETKDSEIANKNANLIAVKKGNEEKTAIKILVESLTQENIKKYISDTFGQSVIPMF